MDKLVLLDSNSLTNRAFWAIPPLNNADGMPTNAIYGFINMLIRIIEYEKPQYIAAAFDVHAPTFRHKMYDGYKATRKPMPEELRTQIPRLKELLKAMGIAVFELEGFEADDIIGTLAKKSMIDTIIITGDRDALQLVDDKINVHLTKRGITDIEIYNTRHLKEVYGFGAERIIDYKALLGDSSDNIPGVNGIGEKTALSIVNAYGGLNEIYSRLGEMSAKIAEKLRVGKESAYFSYDLARIDTNVPIEFSLNALKYSFPFSNEVKNLFAENNFLSLLKRKIFVDSDTISDAPKKLTKPATESKEQNGILNEVFSMNAGFKVAKIVEVRLKEEFDAQVLPNWQNGKTSVAFFSHADYLSLAFDYKTEYRLIYCKSLLDFGFTLENAVEAIKPILESLETEKILFDYKAFRHELESFGVGIKGQYTDIQLAQYCIDCTIPNNPIEDILHNIGLVDIAKTPASAMHIYIDYAKKELAKVWHVYQSIEIPLQGILYDIECYGFKIDVQKMNELGFEYEVKLKELTEQIYSLAGTSFNLNSPQQLGAILFDKLKLSSHIKTKTKRLSTGIDVLQELEKEHPIIPLLIRYRTLSKLNGTYIEGLRKLLTSDNILHTIFKQTVTQTGRLSSVEPNLQNIPIRDKEGRQIRKFFIAREGFKLISADYSQIELRLLAHLSNCKRLIDAYQNSEDIHARTAGEIFSTDIKNVTSEMRRRAKTINFGIIYGMSDFGLAKELNIKKSEAHAYIERYFSIFPEIKTYFNEVLEKARRDGYVKTMSGRVRRMSGINHSNYLVRSFNERAAMNMPLQGAAADLIKYAMINVEKALKDLNLDAHILCQVHDELIIEARADCAKEVSEVLKREMENAEVLKVPLVAEAGIADNWYDL